MSLQRLSDVSVGSLVKFGDSIYKLDWKKDGNFLFQKKVGPFFETERRGAGTLINDYDGPEAHLVTVVEVASGSQPDLTSQLRAQVKSKSLTDSLRAQVDAAEEADYEERYGDDDGDEEDAGVITTGSIPSSYLSDAILSVTPASVSYPTGAITKDILTANLRSQQASQEAKQAQLNASVAKAKATGVEASVDYLARHIEVLEHNTILLRDDADEESYRLRQTESLVDGIQQEQEEHDDRISALERKHYEEEQRMNAQNALNEKLALQAKFNEAAKKQTTGGNGMKNVLGNFKNQFGKVEGKFAFAATGGIALRSGLTNTFVSYDKDAKSLTDVSGLTLKFDVPAFKLPVAADQVKVGDLIIHNAEFVFVTKKADGYLEVINPEKGVNGSVVPTKNAILNAAFYTVVKTLDAAGGDGFNPLLLMALSKGESKDNLLPLLLMGGNGFGGQGAQGGQIDPMMFMLLGDKVDDILPLVLMQQGGALGGNASQGGIQSILPFLLMGDDKDSKDMLPLMMMSGGFGGQNAQAGAINPMMMMALAGDGDIDPMMLMAMGGGFGGQGGGLFGGQAPQQAPAQQQQEQQESQSSEDGE